MPETKFEHTLFDSEEHALLGFLWEWSGQRKGIPAGSFEKHLIECFIRADGDNRARLASVYPAYFKAWQKCKSGELD